MHVSAIINARVVSQKTSLLSNRNSGAEQHFVNMEVKTWPFEVMQSGHEREICLTTITAVLFGTNEGELFWRVILKHRHVLVWVCCLGDSAVGYSSMNPTSFEKQAGKSYPRWTTSRWFNRTKILVQKEGRVIGWFSHKADLKPITLLEGLREM